MGKKLSPEGKKLLLGIAREAIVAHIETGTVPKREEHHKLLL